MEWVRNWLEATACPSLDPERDERVEALAHRIGRNMRHEGKFFNLLDAAEEFNVHPEDLPLVQDRLYELTLKYVMQDYSITERDRAGLRWVARNAGLDSEQARLIELRVGRRVFEQYLAFAIAGGFLDEEELTQLRRVAGSLNVTTRQLAVAYLADAGLAFLKQIIEGMAENAAIPKSAWQQLIHSLAQLGVKEEELVESLREPARTLAERMRTQDPSGDEELDRERAERFCTLKTLLNHLGTPLTTE